MQTTSSRSRYEILGTLGSGATSRVDKARDTILGRTVALKTLVHSFGAPVDQKQFLREAQIVSQLSDPAIVNLYDVGIEDGSIAYLVMEYVPGKTLQQVLAAGPIPVARACAWAADLAGALRGAHRAGVIHGDIKPANILVTEDGKVKLGDFGIARFATQVSRSGQLMGTPAYLSPEQILGETQSTRSDLFSLGILLYQMVTGVAPFEGSSVSAVCAQILSAEPVPPSQRNPVLPAGLDHVILRCLAKSPADRYPSAEAFASSLYPFSLGTSASLQAASSLAESLPAPAVDTTKKSAASCSLTRPTKAADAWVAAAAMLLVIGTGWGYYSAWVRLGVPLLPPTVMAAPKPPKDLTQYSQSSMWYVPDETQESVPERVRPARRARVARVAHSVAQNQPSRAIAPASKQTNLSAAVSAPELPAPTTTALVRTVDRAPLRIEIESTVKDGALAIFADQTVVYTTELRNGHAAQLERTLAAGPHQLRVALYRPDKSLQVMKEGLGEIRTDSPNALKIHVGVKSKLWVKRERSLVVTWPSAMQPSGGGAAAPASLTASTK
jgi:eukaryotic-like serine/threonine-protein kinase